MRSLTLNNAVANIEDTFRTDRNITPTTLGGAALKKLAGARGEGGVCYELYGI